MLLKFVSVTLNLFDFENTLGIVPPCTFVLVFRAAMVAIYDIAAGVVIIT